MAHLDRDLIFIMLQYLKEHKFTDAAHQLERESGLFFDISYFEELVLGGELDEAEKYLSGFTKANDNNKSVKIFYEIRKEKYLEALDKGDREKAEDILQNELKVFSMYNEKIYKDLKQLSTLNHFREREELSYWKDAMWARNLIIAEIKNSIGSNPLLQDKLKFPSFKDSRLSTLISQSLNWQHIHCENPRPNPEIKTLYTDHTCAQLSGAGVPNLPMSAISNLTPSLQLNAQMALRPFQANPAALPDSLASLSEHEIVNLANRAARLALGNPVERPRPIGGIPDEASHQINEGSVGFAGQSRPPNDLPRTVARTFSGLSVSHLFNGMPIGLSSLGLPPDGLPTNVFVNLPVGSSVTSMDFHPRRPTRLLVGTNVGDISVWELASNERLVHNSFKVRNLAACSIDLQTALANNPSISVNKVIWNSNGNLLGVAYSKNLVHLFFYFVNDDLKPSIEIDAHVGGVNDIVFSTRNNQLLIITCGDDKMIKVWDAFSGDKRYAFEGHKAPVCSVCPGLRHNLQFIFSMAVNGEISAWFYNNHHPITESSPPGHWNTTMTYSADGSRLFSCGTSKEGKTHLVEWNESEGTIKKRYNGFSKRSIGVVQFDTTKNRFLAVGDDYVVKFWDVDYINLLYSTDAGGGLQASPRIRFSKEGKFLAVSTNDNCIRVLANLEGLQLLRELEDHQCEITRVTSETVKPPAAASAPATETAEQREDQGLEDDNSRVLEDPKIEGAGQTRKLKECCCLRLADNFPNGEGQSSGDGKLRVVEEAKTEGDEKTAMLECRSLRVSDNFAETKNEEGLGLKDGKLSVVECYSLRLPNNFPATKVMGYGNLGVVEAKIEGYGKPWAVGECCSLRLPDYFLETKNEESQSFEDENSRVVEVKAEGERKPRVVESRF